MARRSPYIGLSTGGESLTYNDPNLFYNDPNYLYSGTLELVLLSGRIQGGRTKKSYPEPEMMNVLFKTAVTSVNKISRDPVLIEKKYAIKKNDKLEVKAFLTENKTSLDTLYVSSSLIVGPRKIVSKR